MLSFQSEASDLKYVHELFQSKSKFPIVKRIEQKIDSIIIIPMKIYCASYSTEVKYNEHHLYGQSRKSAFELSLGDSFRLTLISSKCQDEGRSGCWKFLRNVTSAFHCRFTSLSVMQLLFNTK